MSQQVIDKQLDETARPWKRIGEKRIKDHVGQEQDQASIKQRSTTIKLFAKLFANLKLITANLFLIMVHKSARLVNRPLVDIGRSYSVSEMHDRIAMLEEILVRQWSNLKDDDFLVPNEEVKQYIAACHVARQYERISKELLATRLGISQTKASSLIEQMMDDEIITESYTVTYHDVRRSVIDAAIERKIGALKKISPSEFNDQPTPSKKH